METYSHLRPKDRREKLLDPVTGDLLEFDDRTQSWISKLNVGIHNKQMNEINKFGREMMPRPKFYVDPVKREYDLVISTNNESIVHVDKLNNQHYLFKSVDKNFVISHSKNWMMHPVSFINPNKRFNVLASCDISPQIIEIGDIIGCRFAINRKYKETVKILHNYVQNVMKRIKYEKISKESILVRIFFYIFFLYKISF